MNIKEAKKLKQGERIFTTDNRSFVFMALDDHKDIMVECKSSIKGWITLLRICVHTQHTPLTASEMHPDIDDTPENWDE